MKKVMGLSDIIFINVTAIIGLRWLPIAAGYGASSILMWILAAAMFFIPLGLVSTELATTWPEEGGIYVWVKKAYGDKTSFLVAWFYWVNSFFYLPSLLTFISVTLAFLINPVLAKNKLFICSLALVELWIVTLLNFRDIKVLKRIADFGGILGIIVPGLVIIGLGFFAAFVLHYPIPTDYSFSQWIPNLGSQSHIVFLSTLMFSMAGIELTPILAGETKDPQKTFPKATLISALIIVGIYIIGTAAITFVIAPAKIGAASGVMDALKLIGGELHLPFIAPLIALLVVIGSIGGSSVWLVVPIKMFFESCKGGVLPEYFTRCNKNGMPSNAILTQACITSIVILLTSLMPSVNTFYEILVLMATITYFIPYLAMFFAFLKLRRTEKHVYRPYKVPGGKFLPHFMAYLGIFSVLLAILLPFLFSPEDIQDHYHILLYRLELIAGVVFFGILGYYIYKRHEKRTRK